MSDEREDKLFQVGDRVHGKGCPFWLTVRKVINFGPGLHDNRYQCCFGISDNDAGIWRAEDLRHEEEA